MDFRNVLANAKEQLASYAEYSVKNITHICSEYGPRECGSENEKNAQEYMGEQLKNYADSVTRETFDAHPKAFMSFVPIAGGMLLASTAANLTGAFKKKQSGNVIAVRKASGETKRRIIISGHTDSAPEWTYTYKLGSKGVVTVAGYAVAGLLYDIAATAVSLKSKNSKLKKGLALGQLAFVPAFAGLFKFTDQNRHVDGASDDLSGCYIANSVLKFLADNDIRFENTEVIAMLAGGEECGLRGSKAFFAAHPELLNDGVETVFVGFDTIRDEEYMMIYTKDLNGLVKNDIDACNLVKNAAAKCGKDVPFGAIPLGSTDAAAASQAGCKAASFVAMDPAPARYYHTRLDTADNLVPSTIEKTVEIALQTVFDFDEKGLE